MLLLTYVLVSCGLWIFNLCTSLINLSLNDWRIDTWTKVRLMEWTFWPSLWRKLQGKKGKKEKHLKPSINSSDIFFPLPRKKTSIRSLSDIRRRVLQKIYCSNCKRNLLLQQKTEFLLSQFVRFITGYVFFLIVFFLVGAIPDNRLKLIFSVGISTTVEPLLSGPLLSGQPLFGGQGPKLRKDCQVYTAIKFSIQRPTQPRPASCSPKGGFVLFYTSIKWPGPGCSKAGER